jgi:hypothetical protein
MLNSFDVGCLQTFGALFDGEFHLLAFFKVAETFGLNGREVDEYIRAAIAGDEAVALAAIEPFDRTDYTFRHFLPPKQKKKKDFPEQYVFNRAVNKKRLKGIALSRRPVLPTKTYLHPTLTLYQRKVKVSRYWEWLYQD